MVWPLTETPQSLIEKNEAKVRLIVNHVRKIPRGTVPFFMDVSGDMKANLKSKTQDIEEFTDVVTDDFDALFRSTHTPAVFTVLTRT